MGAQDSPGSLPQGWTVQFNVLKTGRKVKVQKFGKRIFLWYCRNGDFPAYKTTILAISLALQHYVNSGNGKKFFSKDDLMQYVKAQNPQLSQPHLTKSPIKRPSKDNQLIGYINEHPEWLPHGWIMELKTRKSGSSEGKLYKCYVDTSTGQKCYSKPEVLQYLKTVKQKSSTSKQKEVLIEKPTAEYLSPGWIKEMEVTRSKDRTTKDPPSSAAKRQKLHQAVTRSQKIGGNASSDISIMASSSAYSLRRWGGKTSVSSLTTLPVATTIETSLRKSSNIGGTEYKENSNVNWSSPTNAEDSERNQDQKVNTDGGPRILFPEADESQEQNSLLSGVKNDGSYRKKTQNDLSKSNHKNEVNLPRRSSKRLAGIEPDMLIDAVSIVQLSSSPVKKQGRNTGSGIKGVESHETETQSSLSESNNKKGRKLAYQCSKQLAELEPEPVANLGVHTLPKTIRSGEGEAALAVDLNDSVLADEASNQNQSKPRKELLLHSSYDAKNLLLGVEPEPVVKSVSVVQALPKTFRPAKEETALAVGLTNGVLADEVSKQSHSESRKELLLGVESEPAANSLFIVQALPKTMRPDKDKTALAALSNGVLAAEASKQKQSEPRKELLLQHTCDANDLLFGEPENKSQRSDTIWSALTEAKVSRGSKVKIVNADNGPVLTPEADIKQKQNCPSNGKKLRGRGKVEKNLRASSTKKGQNLLQRSSRRLAGLGTELVANSVSSAQALQKSEISYKNESILAVGSIPSGGANEKSKQIQADPGLELPRHVLPNFKNSTHRKRSNKNQMLLHGDAGSKDKSHKVGKIYDKKSESEIIPPFGEFLSDPCLEFAYRTLTGELPVEITPDNGLVSTPAADVIGKGNLTMKKRDKCCYRKAQISSRKSKTSRKLSLFHQAMEDQPEPSSIVKNSAFKNAARMSVETGAVLGMGLALNNSAVAPEAGRARHQFANAKKMPQNEPSNNEPQQLDNLTATEEHLQTLEVEKNLDRPEQPPFFSFTDYWSDPCFEFAFKTLTGAIPVEDSLQNQSYFQQQVDISQTQQQINISQTSKDVGSSLPDFGLPGFFQTDISVHFDSPEKQLALQPQMPVNNQSFLSSGSVSLASCSSLRGQQPPHVKENKGLRGKVNS